MGKLRTFSSNAFKWKSGKGTTTIAQLGMSRFPVEGFYIKSERTGQLALFLYDSETMEANEFFDGEAHAFLSPGAMAQVQIWC